MPPFRSPKAERHRPLGSNPTLVELRNAQFLCENRSQLVELLGLDAVAVQGLAVQLGATLGGQEVSDEGLGGFQFGHRYEGR